MSFVSIYSWLLWTVGSYVRLSSSEHFSQFPLRAVTCDRPGQALLILESQSPEVLGLLCAEFRWSAFNSMAIRRKRYRLRHHGTGIRIRFWHIYRKTKTFLLRVNSDTITQMTLLVPISHSRLKIQTMDLLYLYSTGLQGVQLCYN